MSYISRDIEDSLKGLLKNNPVTALTGPRQCGKSTLAKKIISNLDKVVYLDLERPSDLAKLNDAEWFFLSQKENLFCVDEVQRKPELFTLLRSLVDEWGANQKFFILGSASRDFLKQSSESLAGRISYIRLTPFLWKEINNKYSIEQYMVRGGFPSSLLAKSNDVSYRWREDFISAFLERDLLQWAGFSSVTMHRLWQMLAYNNGQTVNYSRLGKSLGVSNVTVSNYIDLLHGTFMVEVLPPYISNTGKRLVKTPKVYIADPGITTALLNLESFQQLTGNPVFGTVWEQIILCNLTGHFPSAKYFFYRTSAGAEIDIVMKHGNKIFAIESKATLSPGLTKGNYNAIDDIKPDHTYVVIPAQKGWPLSKSVDVVSLDELIDRIGRKS